MLFNTQNIVAWHDRSTAEHISQRDQLAAEGFSPISLSIYGDPAEPRYAAVMVKRPQSIPTHSVLGLSQSACQKFCAQMAQEGFGPFIITATGAGEHVVFAGAFRAMARPPLVHLNLSKEQFGQLNQEQRAAGGILLWADAFGTDNDPRYCAIWALNPERIAWNTDALDDGGPRPQQRFDSMASVGARAALVAVTPAKRIMKMYVDSQIGPWVCRAGMTSEEYQAEFDRQTRDGLWPVSISGAGEHEEARYAAIFVPREEHLPRVFRATGSYPVPAIDAALEKYVKDQNLRGVALAIVNGTRLVYARGYTFAEAAPAYHDIQPSTPFRQADLAKTFCAVAVWKLIEQQQLQLETPLQSVLELTQPDGTAPKDARFAQITIEHLLQGISGVDQGAVWNAVSASQAIGGTLPTDAMEVARWITTLDLTGLPGEPSSAVYGNTDYFLLGLLVAKKMGVDSFEAALALLVLHPLGQKSTRGSRSLTSAQLADEARHHLTVHDPENGWPLVQLATAGSVRTADRPLVPLHYGSLDYEMLDGCGGLSASVVDVARLCAMLACRTGNPVLSASSIDAMLGAAVKATVARSGRDGKASHGYHGCDWALPLEGSAHQIQFGKAGWLPGQESCLVGTTGGLFYVLAQNGNSRPDAATQWQELIQPLAEARDWGTTDLFPTFGMASLPATTALKPAPVSYRQGPHAMLRQVVASLARTVPARIRSGRG
jgi:CubicO group peptidase (beta-lactamase class C family)